MEQRRSYLFILIACLVAVAAQAAGKGPQITLANTTYDMGTIHASKGNVKATYKFTNTGDEPLVIISVTNGGCGCTKPSYPLQPIAPGKTGQIVINFNPKGRRGELRREVRVKTNAKGSKRLSLKFTGVIIP